jgi:hypothetical protein
MEKERFPRLEVGASHIKFSILRFDSGLDVSACMIGVLF